MSYQERKQCSLCRSPNLEVVLELPPSPLANEFTSDTSSDAAQEIFPQRLVMCVACRHLQSAILVAPERLFGNYVYATATSPLTIAHLREQARTIDAVLGIRRWEGLEGKLIVEIGSNDGSLLEEFALIGVPRGHMIGVEPAKALAEKTSLSGFHTLNDFFSTRLARKMREIYVKPTVVIANNVFAHVPDVRDAIDGVKHLVGDEGTLVMEVAHAQDLLDGAWDTIYHEHLSHHAFGPLMDALADVGLPVFDVDIMKGQVGRGSMRVWAGKSRVTSAETDMKIAKLRVSEIVEGKLDSKSTWAGLEDRIAKEGSVVRRTLAPFVYGKKKIWGYGAPAKMTTIVYSYEIEKVELEAVADDSSWKQGLLTPGTRVPVRSFEELVAAKPDLVILFAWNFADDLRRRLKGTGFTGATATPQELARGEVRT